MKSIINRLRYLALFAILFLNVNINYCQINKYLLGSANVSWKIRSQADVGTNTAIHTVGFNTTGWVNAVVPGTVFGSYVAAGLESDPNYGDNITRVDKTKYDRNYFYRAEFTIPASFTAGKIWLNLEGVNRDADVYVNGTLLGSIHGIVQRGMYDVTSVATKTGTNVLVVLNYVPVPPLNCSASPTYISSASWDWMPYVPGLNMGITDDIYLTNTNNVTVVDPWIRTDLPTTSTANLSVNVNLKNNATTAQNGTLTAIINPGNIQVNQSVTLAAGEQKSITLDKNTFSQLTINNPNLWWPNGYGAQNLYTAEVKYTVGSVVSDTRTVSFGIKKYTYDTNGGVMHFWVNGKRIYIKGGNWGMSEYMLRCRGAEYDTKLRLHKEMNLNMVRNWVGSVTDEEFYNACDKYGLMVWDDFWLITTFIYFPRDQNIFNQNVIEKIKRNRNHPCVAMWCGANEFTPPSDYDALYRSAVSTYDANDRYYQPNSNSGNLSGSGPWMNFKPAEYFSSAPYMMGGPSNYGLRTELGTPVFTTFESFKKFIPQANWWPRNNMWNLHYFGLPDGTEGTAGPTNYFNSVNNSYGTSSGIEEFCTKAQMLNIETNKAMYEGWQDHLWNDASGLMIWMSQSAFPSLVWQTYDYYYDLTGAYWGVKKANERFHIQWNSSNNSVKVINLSSQSLSGMTSEAKVYNKDGNEVTALSKTTSSFSLGESAVYNCFTLFDQSATLSDVHFIKLKLKDGSGTVWSENFYWRGTTANNYSGLNTIPVANLTVSSTTPVVSNGKCTFSAQITNPAASQSIAFGIRVQVVKSGTSEQVLPIIQDDNYFSLLKGESKTVNFEFDNALLGGTQPALKVTQYSQINSPSGTNLALNKPATVSSSVGSNTGAMAVDGNTGSRWESAASDPQWVYVDLGATYNINRVKITWEGAYGKDYKVQLSSNLSTWTDIKTVTGNSTLVNDHTGLSGSGRYLRIYGTARGTIWGYSIYELEAYGSLASSGSNLALNKTTTVSSTNSTNTGSLAVDGNSTSRWESAYSDPQWLYVDLGTSYSISRVKVTWEGAYGKDYQVQASSDASNWNNLKTVTGNTALVNDHTGLSGSGRYVRIYGTSRGTIWGYSICELEVYSTGALRAHTSLNKEENQDNIVFYPNPVSRILFIEGLQNESVVELYNTDGRKIMNVKGNQLDVTDLKAGYYIVRINDHGHIYNKSIIKQ